LCCSASERISPLKCPSADALPPPRSGVPCGMLAIVMKSNRRHHREKLDRPRCAIINRKSDVCGNARPQYQLMDGLSHGCEAIALPPCTERDVQRVTSKVGMEPGRQFCYIFQCISALPYLVFALLLSVDTRRLSPFERHPRYAC
jgi:hypothetical protein